jgi:hypothetical protein
VLGQHQFAKARCQFNDILECRGQASTPHTRTRAGLPDLPSHRQATPDVHARPTPSQSADRAPVNDTRSTSSGV